jgi:hypothetical protein
MFFCLYPISPFSAILFFAEKGETDNVPNGHGHRACTPTRLSRLFRSKQRFEKGEIG